MAVGDTRDELPPGRGKHHDVRWFGTGRVNGCGSLRLASGGHPSWRGSALFELTPDWYLIPKPSELAEYSSQTPSPHDKRQALMTNIVRSLYRRLCTVLPLLLLGLFFVGGCTRKPPEPTQTKEERRLQEKEMMQREMRNE